MKSNLPHWALRKFKRIVSSIAFYPAFLATVFLIVAYIMIQFDFSDTGKNIKSQMTWLRLKDASTARTITSVIAAGILSLTVFSFTMVMVILNQAASQMSNRVLDKLIGNRYQQMVLGFYIGTIVYSLFLLSSIRDIDSGIYVPALSTYMLIAMAIVDIFFFIYFLHYITQSVKYGIIINRICKQTQKALKATCRLAAQPEILPPQDGQPFLSPEAGVFEGFNKEALLRIAGEKNCVFSFLYTSGNYVLKDTPVLRISPAISLTDETREGLQLAIHLTTEESIDSNFYYGFRQLTEIALKALSPGINDPGTAVEAIRALASLLAYRLKHFPDNVIRDEDGAIRIITQERTFEEIFNAAILPIWDYGKHDRFVQNELLHLLQQLQFISPQPVLREMTVKLQWQKKATEQGHH